MHLSVVSQIKAKQSWEKVGKTAANTIKLIWLVNVILIVWREKKTLQSHLKFLLNVMKF